MKNFLLLTTSLTTCSFMANAGAVSLGDGSSGTFGTISSSNSIVGTTASAGTGLKALENSVNNNILVKSGSGVAAKVYLLNDQYNAISAYDGYTNLASSDISLSPDFITGVLNAGTAVVLQANNDITVEDDIIANNTTGDGGDLTLQAGRSILINANIFSDNGNVYLLGNQKLSTGVVNAYRDAGNAVITMASGTSIDAGTGDIIIRLDDGAGLTNDEAGDITLAGLSAETILVENVNATGDVVLDAGSVLSASGANDAITLVSGRNFINNGNASSLDAASGRWLVYSTDPADDVLGGLTRDFRRFSCTYGGSCPSFASTGNGFLYSITPMLTVTPDALPAAITAGDAVPSLTGYAYTLSGYLDMDDEDDDAVTGTINGSTGYMVGSGAGTYDVSYDNGTLASALGYGFTYDDNLSALTVNAAPIITPPTPTTPSSDIPDTVVYMGLGGYLHDIQSGKLHGSEGQKKMDDANAVSFDLGEDSVTTDKSNVYRGLRMSQELREILIDALAFNE